MRIPAAVTLAAVFVALGSSAASASEGSVPAEVTAYVDAPDGLVPALDDFFGVGANGQGYDFDDTTTTGPVDRVFTFTTDWLAGATTDTAVGLSNEWTVPVSIADKPIGVAIVWINPGTVRPELADFVPDVAFATALADVPDGSYLVHDAPRQAWFVLTPPTLTPLAAGTSGVSGDTTLAAYQGRVGVEAPEPEAATGFAPSLSIVIIVGVALVVILVLLVPLARRRRGEAVEPAEPDED